MRRKMPAPVHCQAISKLNKSQRRILAVLSFGCFVLWFAFSSWTPKLQAPTFLWVTREWVQDEISMAMTRTEPDLDNPAVRQHFDWPKPTSIYKHLNEATDGAQSTYYMVKSKSDNEKYKLGDVVEVRIVAYNGKKERKTYGGDFWRVLLKSPDLKSSIHGRVTDHQDGTYTASVPLHFPGKAILTVSLIHPSEAVDMLRRVTSTRTSPGLEFEAQFEVGLHGSNGRTSWQQCNTWLPSLKNRVPSDFCNFSSPTNGEPWICEKPVGSTCGRLLTYRAIRTNDAQEVLKDTGLFVIGKTLRVPIGKPKEIYVSSINAASITDLPPCTLKDAGVKSPVPAGYFINDKWKSLHCNSRSFEDVRQEVKCLRNKSVHILGDSTIRQWYGRFILPGLLKSMNKVKAWVDESLHKDRGVEAYETDAPSDPWEPREAFDQVNNVAFYFAAHGPPLQNGGPPTTMPYISDRIDKIAGGKDTVVTITIGFHLLLYEPYTYVRRLRTIANSIQRLLRRAPETLVVYKGLNTFTMDDVYPSPCCLSEWLAYRYNEIARSVLSSLPVVFLDCWDMTAAHYSSSDNLHPLNPIIESEVKLLLSYMCPHDA